MAYLFHDASTATPNSQRLVNPEYTLYINVENSDLKEIYQSAAMKHNDNIYHNHFPDSGFDVYNPKEMMLSPTNVNKVDLGIKCEMVNNVNGTNLPSAFYLYPRSSISKTKFRLANNVGIIDSGYRGSLGAMIDVVYSFDHEETKLDKHQRLFQICNPILSPFKIVILNDDSELSSTPRGADGFGSTGS
tara:strand:- start:7359 stop:7925 length:567 start_codon:yes stop_codon:yes gene_type:complete